MSFEKNISPEIANPELIEKLEWLQDFSLEKIMCQELLPDLSWKETFVATRLIENICKMNPKAVKVLNK